MNRRTALAALALLAATGGAFAQEGRPRAWQRRLDLTIPLTLPLLEVSPVDPFAEPVDAPPQLAGALPPRKVPVHGPATVAAYVDERGRCLGAVPVQLPFPGIGPELVRRLMSERFEPARAGPTARPSWTALSITLAGTVKRATVLDADLELPDPEVPPEPGGTGLTYGAGRLAQLPAADPAELTSVAVPRRLSLRVPGMAVESGIRVLVRVGEGGRVERFLPLEVPEGLVPWVRRFLAGWTLAPATREGRATACWVVYRARVRFELSALRSTTVRLIRDRRFDPASGSLVPLRGGS